MATKHIGVKDSTACTSFNIWLFGHTKLPTDVLSAPLPLYQKLIESVIMYMYVGLCIYMLLTHVYIIVVYQSIQYSGSNWESILASGSA